MPLSGTITVRPTSLGTHTYRLTAGNEAGRTTAQVTVTVTREAKTLKVIAPDTVPRGQRFRFRARGLDPRERYTVRIAGSTIATGHADAGGRIDRRVMVPSRADLGRAGIVVVGSLPDRIGRDRIRVVRAP